MKWMMTFAVRMALLSLTVFAPLALATNESPSELMKEAMVTKAQATAIAMTKVPDGVIKSSELEREHGRLIWSFDIAKPSSKNITEVNVDATTGKVVAVSNETPARERQEAKKEKLENNHP
jgi:hypothetical protein